MKTRQNCICEKEEKIPDETIDRANELLKRENLLEFDFYNNDIE